jgi:hypothetical protein
LGLPSGLFPSGFPHKNLYTPLLSPICTTCPAHLICLDLITEIIWWGVQIISPHYVVSSDHQLPCPS